MKKLVSILIACVMILGLTACGDKLVEDAAKCTIEQQGVKVTMAFDAESDKIVKITQTSTLNIEGLTEGDVTALQESIASSEKEYEKVQGITYKMEQKDADITEKIEMNVGDKKMLQSIVDAGFLPVDEDEVTYLSLDATLEALEEAGWTVEK